MITTVKPQICLMLSSDIQPLPMHTVWLESATDMLSLKTELEKAYVKAINKHRRIYTKWQIVCSRGFYGISLSGQTDLEVICRLSCDVDKYGVAYAQYVKLVGIEQASVKDFEDRYMGTYANKSDFVMTMLHRLKVPDYLTRANLVLSHLDMNRVKASWFASLYEAIRCDDNLVYVFKKPQQ